MAGVASVWLSCLWEHLMDTFGGGCNLCGGQVE